MRLNIEWISPLIHRKPIKSWIFHKWYIKPDFGFTFIGFFVSFSFSALWSGIEFSINISEKNRIKSQSW